MSREAVNNNDRTRRVLMTSLGEMRQFGDNQTVSFSRQCMMLTFEKVRETSARFAK